MSTRYSLLLSTLFITSPFLTICYGQEKIQTEQVKVQETLLEHSVVPSLLIGTGIWTIYTDSELNKFKVQQSVRTKHVDFSTNAEHYLQFAPLTMAVAYKIHHKDYKDWKEFSSKLLLAEALMLTSVYTLKNTTKHKRPYPYGNLDSFPSEHTAQAFIGASILHREIGHENHWLVVMGYTTATVTATLRVMNNKHYISDVLVGAGIGLLSTHLSYWVIDKIKKRKKARTFK